MSSEKMASPTETPAESAGSRRSTPPARKKRRRWKRRLLLLCLAAAAAIAFAPQIIARTSLRNSLIARVNPKLDGKLILGQTSLGWLSPIEIEQVQLLHAEDEHWATIEGLKSEYTLLDLLLEPSDLGRWTASRCEVTAVCEPGSTDVERWLAEIGTGEKSAPRNLSFETENLLLTLKSAGVESQFQVTEGTYQQNRAGEVSFGFQGSPVQHNDGQTPSLTVGAKFDEGVHWDVSGTDFPLEQLEPLLVRFALGERIAGRASGGWTISEDDGQTWQIAGKGNFSDLQIQAGDRQLADVDTIDLTLSVSRNKSDWHFTTLSGATSFGEVALEGEIDLPAETGSWQETLNHLLDQSFALNGTVELGDLTRRFPSLLTLQEGVKLNQGTCDFQLKSSPEQNLRRLITVLDVSEIDAETPAQTIRWEHPFHANATVGQNDDTWQIEDLKIDSKSVSLTGSGTWESAELDANIDLAAFAQEWSQIFDLSDLQLAGTLQAHAESRMQQSRQIELNGNLTGQNLVIGWGTERPWELALLKGEIAGTGAIGDAGKFELTRFEGTVHTQKELLTLTRLNADEAGRQHWQIKGSGDMTGLAGQWLTRNSNVRMLGSYRIETAWLHDAERESFPKLDLEFRNFELISGDLSVAEPQLKITGDLSLETATSRFASRELIVNCPTVAARLNDLNLSTAGGLRVSGKLAARGRVERLWYYVDSDLNAANPTGFLNVQLAAVPESDDDTQLNWKVTAQELRWPAARNETPVRPVSDSGRAGDSVASISPVWSGSGRYLRQEDQLVIEQSELSSDALNFNLQGRVTALTSAPVATIEGVCRYDWEQLTRQYPGLLGPDLKLYGSHQSPVKLTCPLSGDSSSRKQMSGSVSLTWDRGEWNALPIGGATLAVDLSPERMQVRPVEVSLAKGTAKFGPTIERSSNGAVLLQAPERLLDRVQLTDEICHQWLKYVSPLTADAARVSGSFTVDNTKVLRVPLDRWQQMSAEGLVQIHTAEMRPGPLAMQFITLSKQIEALRRGTPFDPQAVNPEKPLMTITKQVVPCKIQDGRVYHKDLTIVLGDLSVTTSGSVGFDDTLDLVANIEIPEKWKIRGKPVREIWGANIQIPIRGTIGKAPMDPRVIQSLMDRLVRGTVTNFLENELNKQLNKLFQPK